MLGPFLGEWLIAGLAFQDSAQTGNRMLCDWLEQNALRCRLNNRACALLDVELTPKLRGNDDLTLGGKPY